MPTISLSGIVIFAPDVTPPTLTSPTGTETGQTTASGTVSTDEAGGTLYYLASTNATETAGTVTASGQSQAVSGAGVQNVTVSGLSANTGYYLHYVHVDASGNASSRVSSAQFTTDSAGGVTISLSGITITLPVPVITSVTSDIDAETDTVTLTINTTGTPSLTGATTVTAAYGGVALTDVTVVDADTLTGVRPVDGFELGSMNGVTVTVDGRTSGAYSFEFEPILGAVTTLSVGWADLAMDSKLREPRYATLAAGDQFEHTPNTLPTVAAPSGYPVTMGPTGLLVVDGAEDEPEPLYVDFTLIDALDEVGAYRRGNVSRWTLHESIPTESPVIAGWTAASTTYAVTWTFGGTNLTGFEYRVNGGAWTAIGASPLIVNGATASTVYTVDVRAVNGLIPGPHSTVVVTTTSGIDTTPDAFTLVDQTDAPTDTQVWSQAIQVLGVTAGEDIAVTVSGAASRVWRYSTDGGQTWSSPTAIAGNVRLNYLVQAGLTTSAAPETAASVTLNIGGVSDTFTATTAEDNVAPVITLTGGNQTLTVGEDWIDPGYTAADAVDGDLTDDVVITGTVDTDTPGTYTLTYTVSDAAGNVGTAQRTVTVSPSASGLQVDSAPAEILRHGTFELVLSGAAVAPTPANTEVRVNGEEGPLLVVTGVTGVGPWNVAVKILFDTPIQYGSYPLHIRVGDESVQTESIPQVGRTNLIGIPSTYVNLLTVATGPGTLHDHFPDWELGATDQIVYQTLTTTARVPVRVTPAGVPQLLGTLSVADVIGYRVIKADGTVNPTAFLRFPFEADSDVEYIRDVVPRLLATDANLVRVFLDRDNTVRVTISHDGTAINMEQFSRFVLSGFPDDIDSDDNPDVFDVTEGSGVLDLMLGQLLTSPGVYKLRLVGYSQLHTNGVVLFDPSLAAASVTAIVMNA